MGDWPATKKQATNLSIATNRKEETVCLRVVPRTLS